MTENVQSDIIINVDTSVGIAEIKQLQRQISSLNAQLMSSGAAQAKSAQNIQRNLLSNINATGDFAARVKTIASTTETFTTRLEKNKMGMGEYFRYAGASSKTFGKLFRNEFDTIEKVARERVKTLQTQYIKLGRDANGALKAISVRPLALDMENLATKTAMAAQKQQLMNQLLKQGSTNLLNFGKNTQWAGRQLMVGFSIPLAMLGSAAAKTFMQMEEQAIKFKRVYGEAFTSTAETDKMLDQVKRLASEFTKYGVAVEETMKMAADAAAMGKQGADLLAQVNQAARLAVLGGVDQQQALETTISLTNAFGVASDKLAGKVNFLNAVENQTVTSIEDLTIAIPKAGPVVQQLGGDVEDLAFFLTAMKEGGINASEGANALKSGLASLINPTKKASDMLAGFGVNITGIVEANKGDVKGTVIQFAKALDTLDPLNRARAIEQLFGKFQFARLSTLFKNVIADGSQASKVLSLTNATTQELAILSERELKRVQDSPMYKFKKVVEDLKVSLVPLGEAFLKAVTPIGEFVKGFLDKFNSMGDGAKQFAVIATTVVAGIGPILLMTFGLIANGAANLIKLFLGVGKVFQRTGKGSQTLGSQTDYMTQQQLEAAAVAASLDQTHGRLIQTFSSETKAVNALATAYARAVVAQSNLAGVPIGAAAAKTKKGPKAKKLASGVVSVPGPKGAGDVVPAMLSPGEAVIPAKMARKYSGLIGSMISDEVPGYSTGRYSQSTESGIEQGMKKKLRGAPEPFRKAGQGISYGSLDAENKIIADTYEAEILKDTPNISREALKKKIDSFIGTDLSHRSKSERTETFDGRQIRVKNWETRNIQKDHKSVNAFLQNLADKEAGKEKFLTKLDVRSIAKSSGVSMDTARQEIELLKAGAHPASATSYKVLKAIAEEYPSPRARALAKLLEFRLSDKSSGSYIKALTSGRMFMTPNATLDARATKSQNNLIARRDKDLQVLRETVKNSKIDAPEVKSATAARKTTKAKPTVSQKATQTSLSAILASGNTPAARRVQAGLIGKFLGRKYANGVVEVPGPKGAGDIIPAMLSPGESVIPTKMAKKYAPLISGMIKGTLPGFFGGFDANYDPKTDPMNEMSGFMVDAPPGSDPFSSGNSAIGSDGMLSAPPGSDPFGSSGSFDDYEKQNKKMGGKFVDGMKEKLIPAATQFGKNVASEMATGAKAVGKNVWERSKRGILESAARGFSNTTLAQKMSGGAGVNLNGKTYVAGAEVRTDKNGNQYGYIPGVGKTSVEKAQAASVDPKAAKQTAREKFGAKTQKVGMIGMAGSMAVSAATMLPGDAGKTAGDLAPLLLGLSSLAMLVQGPVSAGLATLVAAIAVPVYAMFKSQEAFNQAQDSALALGEAMGVGSSAILKFAEFSGNVTAKEIMDRRRSEGFDGFQTKNGKNTFGKSFLASDAGKSLLDSVQKTKAASGDKAAIGQVTSQMATAVSSGAMSAAQARSVVAQLAQEMGDYSFGIQVNSELISLLGPKGENLLKDPLGIRIQMLNDQKQNVKDSVAEMSKIASEGFQGTGAAIGGAIVGGLAGAGIGAAIGSFFAPGPGTAIGAAIGGLVGLVSGGITGAIAGNIEHQKELGQASAATVEIEKNALDQQQQISDSLEMEYEKRIANAKAAGDTLAMDKAINDLADARLAMMKKSSELNTQIMDSYKNAQDAEVKSAMMTGAKAAVKKTYKGTSQEATANLALTRLADSKATEEQKYMLTLQLSNQSIDPSQMLKILAMSQTNQNIVIGIATKYGGATANEVSTLTSMFIDPVTKKPVESVQTDFLLKIQQAKTPEEFKDTMEFYKKVAQSGAVLNTSVVTDYLLKNPKVAANLDAMFDKLRDTKGKITLKVLASVVGAKEMEAINDDIAYFETLSDNERKVYTQVLATTLETTTITDDKFKNWLSSEGSDFKNASGAKQLSEYAQWNARTVTEANKAAGTIDSFVKPPADPSGSKTTNPLDAILSKLKMVRDASINATGGIKELLRVIGKKGEKNISSFTGIEQNLIKRDNVSSSFMDFYDGLDEKAKKTYVSISGSGAKAVARLTNDGRKVQAALREISIGDFQSGLVKQKQDLANSAKAFSMLKSAGMTSADALEVSRDAELANAIATKANAKEVLDLVNAYKALANAATAADKFQKAFDEANAAWDAKRNKIELDFEINTEAFQQAVTDAQNEIAKKTNEAGGLDDLQAGLTEIGWAEDEINKKYDLRSEALDRVAKANDKILASQKGQLTIADALSRGDISAAAVAIQDQRAQESQNAIQSQRDLMDNARKAELNGITTTVNGVKMTRKDIEAKILTIEKEIFAIEEKRLEPANESIRLKEVDKAAALKSLDLQEREWRILQSDIDLAATAAWDYVDALAAAKGLAAQAVIDAKDPLAPVGDSRNAPGSNASTPTTTKAPVTKAPAAKAPAATTKAPAAKAKTTTTTAAAPKLAANQTSFVDVNGKTVIATKTVRGGTGVYNGSQFVPAVYDTVYTYSKGGIIPNYLANGGSPFAKGTDTVPAMLTPGEFVMSKYAVDNFGVENMKAINSGASIGSTVYNSYDLNVNVRSDANPNEIARAVMAQIKQVDSQRIRGVRL